MYASFYIILYSVFSTMTTFDIDNTPYFLYAVFHAEHYMQLMPNSFFSSATFTTTLNVLEVVTVVVKFMRTTLLSPCNHFQM